MVTMWTAVSSVLTNVDSTSLVIFLLVFLVAWGYLTTPPKLPPGPPGLPIVGNMFSVMAASSDLLAQFHKWHQQYGDVFTLRMGSKYMIVINSYKLAHETYVKRGDIFSGRPSHLYSIQQVIHHTGTGVVFSEGPMWKALRRVTLKTMRDFGVGKKTLEERVHEEARAVVNVLTESQGQPMEIKPLFSKFTANVICSVIFGNRFDYEDPVFTELTGLVNRAVRQPAIFFPANFVTLTRFVPSVRKTLQTFVNAFVSIDEHLEHILKEHEKTYDPSAVRDFVDLYIKTRTESEDSHVYNAANMRRVIIDLFGAGTETSSTTMDWLILFLVAHPHVQQRCQDCIDKVVGQDRQVTSEDRKKLPYIEAVITEILRVNAIAPLGVPHMSVTEGSIGDYRVPAGSIVITNIREIHLDPSTWPDPHVFRPERFLDLDGNFCPPKENYLPFSLGPRTCLGEILARMEIFILLTSLLQAFTFTMGRGQRVDLKGQLGVVYMAKPQPVVAMRR